MLKKNIKFKDFSEPPKDITQDFYFNLTRSELTVMELSVPGGMKAMIERISSTTNGTELMAIFEKIILDSYGEKDPTGLRFIKSKELSLAFKQTLAYDELFSELTTDAKAAAAFVQGILPKIEDLPASG